MNENSHEEEKQKYPSFGLERYFAEKFTNAQFEYGSNQFGVCRYPLDSSGQRIVAVREECPHTLGLDRASFHETETILLITSHKGDTPNSIYFRLNHEIVDIYSNQLDDLNSDSILFFINRVTQHMELLNKVSSFDKFELVKNSDFTVFFNFKYDHTLKRVFRIASIAFNPIAGHEKRVVFTVTDNMLTTMSSLRKMDIEFFNRYYKQKIQHAIPDLNSSQLHAFIDLSTWDESLKSLVKMTYY